jgi:putative ABC transport system permease protein
VSGAGAVWALAGRGLWAHRARLTLSVLAVVLGVAFIAGTLTLTDSLTAGIAKLAPERATATVRAATTIAEEARPALPADLPGRLRRLEGVEAAAGKVLGGVQLKPVTGSVKGPSLGLSWPEDAALSPLELVAGQPPRLGEAAVSAGFARSDHLRVGDAVQVATAQGSRELRVSGIVRVNGGDGTGPAALVVLDLATARRLLGVQGYSSVDVLAARGALTSERLAGLDAGRLELVPPGRAVQDDSAGVDAFLDTVAGILRGFGILALVVGSFLIFNTLSMLAALRTREFGLLRVVGATPPQLGLLVVLEAVMVGGGASLLGVAVGGTAAAGLLGWLASRQLLAAGLAVRPGTVGFAAAAGGIVAVAAALPAALRAARTPPLRALHELPAVSSRPRGWAAVAAVAAASVGGMLVLGGLPAAGGAVVLAGAGLVLAGALLGLPLLVRALAAPLRAAGRRLGISVLLGLENATRNQRRTAATAAALMVGLAAVVGTATYATTWRAATTAALNGGVRADLVVYHATAVGQERTFDPRVAADLRAVDGVRQVVEVRTGSARVQGPGPRSTPPIPPPSGRCCGCGCAPVPWPTCGRARCWSPPGRRGGVAGGSATPSPSSCPAAAPPATASPGSTTTRRCSPAICCTWTPTPPDTNAGVTGRPTCWSPPSCWPTRPCSGATPRAPAWGARWPATRTLASGPRPTTSPTCGRRPSSAAPCCRACCGS